MTFIAGPYTATYDGTAIGITQDGFGIERQEFQEEIRGDNYAQGINDTIHLGEDWFIDFICQEYGAGALKALLGFQVAAGGTPALGLKSQVGQTAIGSSRAKALVLTAVAGTPAASTPASLTATNSIIAPGFNSRMLFAPNLRQVPLRLLLLPFSSTGIRHFTTT